MLSFLPLPSPHPPILEESFRGPARFLPSPCTWRCPSGQAKIAPGQGDGWSCGGFDKLPGRLSEKTATCQTAPDSIPPGSPEATERPPKGPSGLGCAPWGRSGVPERSAPRAREPRAWLEARQVLRRRDADLPSRRVRSRGPCRPR